MPNAAHLTEDSYTQRSQASLEHHGLAEETVPRAGLLFPTQPGLLGRWVVTEAPEQL